MEGRRAGRREIVFAAVVVTCLIGLAAAPTVAAGEPDHATFAGTSYTNEHFVMDIASTGAVIYSLDRTETLVGRVHWVVEERFDGTWTPLSWTSGPSLSLEDAGPSSEFHRVAIRGMVGNRMAVGILFNGKAIDVPSMGPKISVDIQAIDGPGEFRLAWYFDDVSASALLFESRVGEIRSPILGPVTIPTEFYHVAAGENSIVALAADLKAVKFGVNWDDALPNYQSTEATMSDGRMTLRIQFGDFPLEAGERFVLDPIIEGGGGDDGGGTPTIAIGNVFADRESLPQEDRATLSWTTTPSDACDTFSWGTTTSYGNTIQLSCGVHSVTLTGLSPQATYYYRISSTRSGWYSATYSWSFGPLDTDRDWLTDWQETTTYHEIAFSFPQVVYGEAKSHRQGFATREVGPSCPALWNLVGDGAPPIDYIDFHWSLQSYGCVDAKLGGPKLRLEDAQDVSLSIRYSLAGLGSASVLGETPEGLQLVQNLPGTEGQWSSAQVSLEPWKARLTSLWFQGWSTETNYRWRLDDIRIRARTNPWVEDTDGDGLMDGEEVTRWGSNPLTWDTDFDGIADFVDPNLGPDDQPPKVIQLYSDDYRSYVEVTLEEAFGIATWALGVQLYQGEVEAGGTVDELAGNRYRLTFQNPHPPEAVINAQVYIADPYGQEARIYYELRQSPTDPGATTTDAGFVSIGEVSFGYPRLFGSPFAPASYGTAALAAATRAVIPIAMVLFVLYCCTAPNGQYAPSEPSEPNVYLDSDAYALREWSTQIGIVSLYQGFSTTSGGYIRGTGWNFISAIYPSVTLDLIGTILTSGSYTQVGEVWHVDWTTVISGATMLYRLITRDATILGLQVAEVVIDGFGNNVVLDEQGVRRHYDKRYGENPTKYPSFESYKEEIRRTLKNPNEPWHSSHGRGWLYVHWSDPGHTQAFIVILNEDRTFATAGFRYAEAIYSISYSNVPGARFDECIYPKPPPR